MTLHCRASQLQILEQLLSTKNECSIPTHPLIFLTGPASSGKSATLQHLLNALPSVRIAQVSCIERYTDSLLFQSILDQFSGTLPSSANGYCMYGKCESLNEFHVRLNELLEEQDRIEGTAVRYLVIHEKHLINRFWIVWMN